MNSFEFSVSDMNCDGCKKTIERVTKNIAGVNELNADPSTQKVTGEVKNDEVLSTVKERIKRAGYSIE